MLVATCKCVVCEQEVTKRSTVYVEALKGRSCRTHPEVQKAAQDAAKASQDAASMKSAEEYLQIISFAANMRGMHTMKGMPISLMKDNLRRRGVSEDFIKRIEAEVMSQGGYKMTEQDIAQAEGGALDMILSLGGSDAAKN